MQLRQAQLCNAERYKLKREAGYKGRVLPALLPLHRHEGLFPRLFRGTGHSKFVKRGYVKFIACKEFFLKGRGEEGPGVPHVSHS